MSASRVYPPGWYFAERSSAHDLVPGDLVPVTMETGGAGCENCSNGFVFARRITRSGPTTWIGDVEVHATLITAPCPLCRGSEYSDWLVEHSGLTDLELDGKPALAIRLTPKAMKDGQDDAFAIAWKLLNEAPQPSSFALFTSDYGRGKTHILMGLVNGFREANVHATYATSERILRELKATFDDRSAVNTDQVRMRYERVPFMALDEVDRVKWTEWAGEQLFAILNERYQRGLGTAFASNLGPHALGLKAEPLAALVSRISASGMLAALTGADLRKERGRQIALQLTPREDPQ